LVALGEGESIGWGEASPYPSQDEPLEDVLIRAHEGVVGDLLSAAIDEAANDLAIRRHEVSVATSVGSDHRSVPISVAVGMGESAVAATDSAASQGITRFKVKVAPGSIGHVSAIRARHPDAVIGIDANGSFSESDADELITAGDLNLAYIEEPCSAHDAATLHAVREVLDVPVFADESVRSGEDVSRVVDRRLVDGVVIKPGRLGFTGALDAIAAVERAGMRWRASGLLESSVGRAYTNVLASMPNAFVSDVAPADWFLETDVTSTLVENGSVVLPTGPGIGFNPDPAVIERYLVARHDLSHLTGQLT